MDKHGVRFEQYFEEEYTQDVVDFFCEPGAIELISCLRQKPKPFLVLQSQLDVSDGYLSDRVGEARGLALVRTDQQAYDGEMRKVHLLTKMGETASQQMKEIGLSQTHQRLWTIRNEFEEYKRELEGWIDDPDGLEAHLNEYREIMGYTSE